MTALAWTVISEPLDLSPVMSRLSVTNQIGILKEQSFDCFKKRFGLFAFRLQPIITALKLAPVSLSWSSSGDSQQPSISLK